MESFSGPQMINCKGTQRDGRFMRVEEAGLLVALLPSDVPSLYINAPAHSHHRRFVVRHRVGPIRSYVDGEGRISNPHFEGTLAAGQRDGVQSTGNTSGSIFFDLPATAGDASTSV